MKNDRSLFRFRSRTHDQIVIPIKRLLLGGSVFPLLITAAQFALYWLVLGAMMSNTACRIEDDENFIFDEALSLLDRYARSSNIPSESVLFGDFLTPQEA
jgi:hypothetical protein